MRLGFVLKAMESAAQKAGDYLVSNQEKVIELKGEDGKDFLTDADLASEKIILQTLKEEYFAIPAFSEEAGGKASAQGLLWVIDPIDGTINYFHQDDHWGVSIAFVENGITQAGVVYQPRKGLMFSAERDSETVMRETNGQTIKVKVNERKDLKKYHLWLDWGKGDHTRFFQALKILDEHTLYPGNRLCATASLMAVATGRIAGHVFLVPEPFDIAAGALIVEKAGGKVTDLEGGEWTPFSKGIIATNGLIHDQLLEILQPVVNP